MSVAEVRRFPDKGTTKAHRYEMIGGRVGVTDIRRQRWRAGRGKRGKDPTGR